MVEMLNTFVRYSNGALLLMGACFVGLVVVAVIAHPSRQKKIPVVTIPPNTVTEPRDSKNESPPETKMPESRNEESNKLVGKPESKVDLSRIESNFKNSDLVREKEVHKLLQELARNIEKKANHRQSEGFPHINRSVEATGATAKKELLADFSEFDDFIWQWGVRSIVFVSDNDVPFAETNFYLGRSRNGKEEIAYARRFRGEDGFELETVHRSPVGDPKFIEEVSKAAIEELRNLEPYFVDKLPFELRRQ